MAEQQFTAMFREAFWKAHGEKCMDCGRPVLFREMRIDHVIPESVSPDVLSRLRASLDLGDGFDIRGHENLALLCHNCNAAKGNMVLADGVLARKLTRISLRLPNLATALKDARNSRELDTHLRAIVRSIANDRFTMQQMIGALNDLLLMEFMVTTQPAMIDEDSLGLTWSRNAIDDLQAAGLEASWVVSEMLAAMNSKTASFGLLEQVDGAYYLRTDKSLSIVFGQTPHGTIIVAVLHNAASLQGP